MAKRNGETRYHRVDLQGGSLADEESILRRDLDPPNRKFCCDGRFKKSLLLCTFVLIIVAGGMVIFYAAYLVPCGLVPNYLTGVTEYLYGDNHTETQSNDPLNITSVEDGGGEIPILDGAEDEGLHQGEDSEVDGVQQFEPGSKDPNQNNGQENLDEEETAENNQELADGGENVGNEKNGTASANPLSDLGGSDEDGNKTNIQGGSEEQTFPNNIISSVKKNDRAFAITMVGTMSAMIILMTCCLVCRHKSRQAAKKKHFSRLVQDLNASEKFTLVTSSDDESD